MSHDPNENEAASEEYEDELEALLADEYNPFKPSNFAEAMGEMSTSSWEIIASYAERNLGMIAIGLMRTEAMTYWRLAATEEAQDRIAKRNKDAMESAQADAYDNYRNERDGR